MHPPRPTSPTWLDLYDYRQRMARLYRERAAALRADTPANAVLARFRSEKDALIATHPQSPFSPAGRASFAGLHYFPYDPQWQVEARLVVEQEQADMPPGVVTLDEQAVPLRRTASLHFTLLERPLTLAVYWIDVYGGGLFVPFRDTTCPEESYGGGRYLFDTVKGSDLLRLDEHGHIDTGVSQGRLSSEAEWRVQIDFNYAYNPSCAYDARWVCPLAPRENWLNLPISGGERRYE